MPSAAMSTSDGNNDDAKSTCSTLVNGESRNEALEIRQQQQFGDQSTIRHGFDQELIEEDMIRYCCFTEKRHDSNAKPSTVSRIPLQKWRLPERIKTVSGLLVVCLNIGTDPPDIVKTNPCAKLECWIDPFLLSPPKSLEAIGKNLHTQYESINNRIRFRLSLDPSVEDTKKICSQMRRNAKEERILFHYNGHGVPKPTTSGEIWVFNRNYTQYIPVSLFDLQVWLGSPVIYVWDCSSAGNIVNAFNRFAEQRDNDAIRMAQQQQGTLPASAWRDCIQLAACGPNETLPMNPDLPADIFTACLTTPIEMSLRWVVMRNPLLASNVTADMIEKLPGRISERRTPLGELNWIFTAVTDTIAWCVLQDQPELFKRLFRQDLMVASMFRNFLLADRIMRSYQCTPMSTPVLPETHNHPMWQAWELAVDMCLFQLPSLLAEGPNRQQYQPSTFFAEQLTAFEVWLAEGAVNNPKIPEQLPIVLQVLLSQVHRLRALILLSRFLDLGPWAVYAALSVGIFPYVLKLLQSPAAELKPVLVFIWARILAVDRSCQNDLLKDQGFAYFINILTPNNAMLSIPHVSEHRAMSAFILSAFCTNFKAGQQACVKNNVIPACLAHINDPDPLLRQWVCLCLGQVWLNNCEAKTAAIAENGHEKLCALLTDSVPEVRASAMYALGTFLSDSNKTEHMVNIEHNVCISALVAMSDGSPIVRREFVIALSHLVHQAGPSKFLPAANQTIEEDQSQRPSWGDERGSKIVRNRSSDWRGIEGSSFGSTSYESVYIVVWKALLNLSVDPHPDVSKEASIIVDHINTLLLAMPSVGEYASSIVRESIDQMSTNAHIGSDRPQSYHAAEERANGPHRRPTKLTRSASFASTLRTIYNFGNVTLNSTSVSDAAKPSLDKLSRIDHSSSSPSHRNPLERSSTATALPRLSANSSSRANVLPLVSGFYDWSCEYFTEPQMRAAEADEPGSVVQIQRKWRRSRNEAIVIEALESKAAASASVWDDQFMSLYNETEATKLLLHQYEPHLVTADHYNYVIVWDWQTGSPLSVFDNRNPGHSRITDMKFINEEDIALLLIASDDGVVRLYRDYDGKEHEEPVLVSAWRALKDMEKSNGRQSGLVCDWNQGRGTLFTGGDARVIRLWDAQQEMHIMDLPTQTSACVTSVTSDQTSGNIVVAGFGDGLLGVYDRRQPQSSALVRQWDEHKAWVTGVHLQREGTRELVSGGIGGDIKIWDIREASSIKTIQAHKHADMTALALHDQAAVMASVGDDHVIKVWNTDGTHLSAIRPSTGFLNQRNASTRGLAFHPNLMVMATSADDGYVTLYRPHPTAHA